MNAFRVAERSATYELQTVTPSINGETFDLMATAPEGVAKLRGLILALALRGRLVDQDPIDEPADQLLASSRRKWHQLMDAGTIKRERPAAPITAEEKRFLLPSGWVWCRIVDTAQYINGLAFKPSDWGTVGRPIIRIQNLSGRNADYHRTATDVDPSVVVRQGDILVSWSATLDAFIWTGEEGVLNQHIFRVTPSPLLDRQFLFWLLKGSIQELAASDHAHGLVMSHVNRGPFLAHAVAIPPLAEQRRIVARVEDLMGLCDELEAHCRLQDEQHARLISTLFDALVASASPEELAANWQRVASHFDLLLDRPEAADALEQTILQLAVRGLLVERRPTENHDCEPTSQSIAMFPVPRAWKWVEMASVLESGPSNGFSPKPSETQVGIRCLTLTATTKGYFRDGFYKFIDIGHELAAKYFLKRGDLLIQRANSLEYVGIAAIYDGDDDEYTFPDLIMRMRVLPDVISNRYLHIWLLARDARWYFQAKATGTQGNMPKINQAVVRGIPVPLPPITEQHRIVARVEELRGICVDLRHHLQQAQATRSKLANTSVAQAMA